MEAHVDDACLAESARVLTGESVEKAGDAFDACQGLKGEKATPKKFLRPGKSTAKNPTIAACDRLPPRDSPDRSELRPSTTYVLGSSRQGRSQINV